jgi:electron transfer flavoprotein beta subunit
MQIHSLVLVKQVPDTANISGDVMKPDGTVNRSKLPAIFNPEDKVALELALQVKERYGGTVTVITMGPPKASELLRECFYMGADKGYLISDRKFAGADTLATSYVLSEAIRQLGDFQIIFAGRQAIDGDTAQVGPQTAEKLKLPQITYTEEIIEISGKKMKVKRKTDSGREILEAEMPVMMTVVKDAAFPRPFKAKRAMTYKNARTLMELEQMANDNSLLNIEELVEEYKDKNLFIPTLTMDDLKIDPERCGLAGSPTKVFKIDSVVLAGGEHENIEPTPEGLSHLVGRLMEDHILG